MSQVLHCAVGSVEPDLSAQQTALPATSEMGDGRCDELLN